MKRLRKVRYGVLAAVTALALAAGMSVLAQPRAQAAQTGGTAPYLNQWVVSGPYADADAIGKDTSGWQYFDDRIFNRNYDDYNDLMGYFDVKLGESTVDQWVAAATYVYSPPRRPCSGRSVDRVSTVCSRTTPPWGSRARSRAGSASLVPSTRFS